MRARGRQLSSNLRLNELRFFLPRRRPVLGAQRDVDEAWVLRRRIHEGAEAYELGRVLHGRLPLATVAGNNTCHLRLQVGANAQGIVEQYLAQVVDATLEVVEPDSRPLEAVRGTDVKHQEAVEV